MSQNYSLIHHFADSINDTPLLIEPKVFPESSPTSTQVQGLVLYRVAAEHTSVKINCFAA